MRVVFNFGIAFLPGVLPKDDRAAPDPTLAMNLLEL
jgi:hypothetical protein